jgi:acyl-CoA thioesterase-1
MLVLGDSLSAEYGLPRGSGWVALMEKKLQEKKIPITVINASVSGETSSGGKTRLPALLAKHKPDYVIIELGGNDGLRGLPLNAFQANMQAMISAAQQSGARVLLLGMMIPPNYGRDYTEKFAATYTTLAQKNKVELLPFFLQGVAQNDNLFQPDRIHPVASAHPIMLGNVWPHLEKVLKAK